MTHAALQQRFDGSLVKAIGISPNTGQGTLAPAQWQLVNKLLAKSSKCYSRTLALGLSQAEVTQLRQRCKEYCRNILHIHPCCADALALMSRIALDSNKPDTALKLINQAIEFEPLSSACWYSLGHIHLDQGRLKKSKDCFSQAVKIDPDHFRAKAAFAYACLNNGEVVNAFNIYKRLIQQNPNDPHVKTNLFECLKRLNADADNKDLDTQLQRYLVLEDVDHSDMASLISSLLKHRYQLDRKSSQVDIAVLSKDKLYLGALQQIIFSSAIIEDLNNTVRQHLLYQHHCDLHELGLKISLALQAYNNEYVMDYDDGQALMLDSRRQQSSLLLEKDHLNDNEKLLLLDNWVSLVMYEPAKTYSELYTGKLLNNLIDVASLINNGGGALDNLGALLKKSFTQNKQNHSFDRLGDITDRTSKRVKAQYEENPYPRWLALPHQTPTLYQHALDTALPNHGFRMRDSRHSIKVLVAGCGTGKHALQTARYFRNAHVTAIDISHASLSHAKNMAEQYKIKNIDFIQADILELEKLGTQFDIIECSGVLHHMQDPILGAKVLTSLLRPGGLMKIGLYSERARTEVVNCRKLISQQNIESNARGMRALRSKILATEKKWPSIISSPDFYNLSGCRDLLFHEQEHRFTPSQLSKFCNQLGVDFVGFVRVNNELMDKYKSQYPADKHNNNLENWDKFEAQNPSTFGAMYQFYARKPE